MNNIDDIRPNTLEIVFLFDTQYFPLIVPLKHVVLSHAPHLHFEIHLASPAQFV